MVRNGRFPLVSEAFRSPNGLLAYGGDLSIELLLAAYRLGVFPWCNDTEPLLWWSPDPRCILRPERMRVTKSLRKQCRSGDYSITVNNAFVSVIKACAATNVRRPATWISENFIVAYTDMHSRGYAHSVEVWKDRQLVGGLYGVSLGATFFGESMFSVEPGASKLALVELAEMLREAGFPFIDCQTPSEHLIALGAELIVRETFTSIIATLVERTAPADLWIPRESFLRRNVKSS